MLIGGLLVTILSRELRMDLEMQDICCGKLSRDCFGSFKDNVLSFFGIHSPSRWGIYVGEMIDTGFAKGIIGELPSITSAVSKLQDIATSPFSNANLNYDLQGANSSRTSGNETSSRLIL
jgi:hypothetical protein